MQPKLNLEGVTVVDQAKAMINRLAITEAVILFGVMLVLSPLLDWSVIDEGIKPPTATEVAKPAATEVAKSAPAEGAKSAPAEGAKSAPAEGAKPLGATEEITTLAKVWHYVAIVLNTLDNSLPRVSGGAFFYYCIAIAATACGAYGFGVRSWSLIVLGFWMVIFSAVAMACSAVWNVIASLWHILAFLFYLVSEWGLGGRGCPHLVSLLTCVMSLAIAYIVVRRAIAALKPAFHGVLMVGRAQEMDSGLLEFLSPFEGKNHTEVLAILFQNTLMRIVGYSLAGHLVVITVFSIPGFFRKAQDAWTESRAYAQEEREAEKSKAPPKGIEKGEKAGKKGDKGPADKGGEKGEPGVKFETPAAKPTTSGEGDEPDEANTKPTGDDKDYDKHKGRKPTGSGDSEFENLEGGSMDSP